MSKPRNPVFDMAAEGRTYYIANRTAFEKVGFIPHEDLKARPGEGIEPMVSAPVQFVWEALMCRSDLMVRLAQMYSLLEENGIEVPVEWPQVTIEGFDEMADESAMMVLNPESVDEIDRTGGIRSRFTTSGGKKGSVSIVAVPHQEPHGTHCSQPGCDDTDCQDCMSDCASRKPTAEDFDPAHVLDDINTAFAANEIGEALNLIHQLSPEEINSVLDRALVKAHKSLSEVADRSAAQQKMLDQLAGLNQHKVRVTYGDPTPTSEAQALPEALRKMFESMPGLEDLGLTGKGQPARRRFTDRG